MLLKLKKKSYNEVRLLSPVNASAAILTILLLLKSILRSFLYIVKAFGGISVNKFCSRRLKFHNKNEIRLKYN